MTFKEIKDEVYRIIDDVSSVTNEAIIKTGINYAYRNILKEKFNATAPNLTSNTDTNVLSSLNVDDMILAFFGAFYFFKIDGDDEGKGNLWLSMYNEAYSNINGKILDDTTASNLGITLQEDSSVWYTVDKVFDVNSEEE